MVAPPSRDRGDRPGGAPGLRADPAIGFRVLFRGQAEAKRKNLMPVDKAAAEAGCAAILTEDMANGAVLHGVRIINPFAAGA
jgi:hypothetical protein